LRLQAANQVPSAVQTPRKRVTKYQRCFAPGRGGARCRCAFIPGAFFNRLLHLCTAGRDRAAIRGAGASEACQKLHTLLCRGGGGKAPLRQQPDVFFFLFAGRDRGAFRNAHASEACQQLHTLLCRGGGCWAPLCRQPTAAAPGLGRAVNSIDTHWCSTWCVHSSVG